MHPQNLQYALGMGAPVWIPAVGLALLVLVIWSIFWKGLGLWHSAQRGQWVWFLVMLIVNTAGILEIIYLFAIAKTGFHGLFHNRIQKNADGTNS